MIPVAIVSPFLSDEAVKVIEDTLDVNVESTSMVGSDIIGSLITVTNKGFLMDKNATETEVDFARDVFGVEGDIGTVGRGISLVGACSLANSSGAIVAKESTGPEMTRVEEALGFFRRFINNILRVNMITKIYRVKRYFCNGRFIS